MPLRVAQHSTFYPAHHYLAMESRHTAPESEISLEFDEEQREKASEDQEHGMQKPDQNSRRIPYTRLDKFLDRCILPVCSTLLVLTSLPGFILCQYWLLGRLNRFDRDEQRILVSYMISQGSEPIFPLSQTTKFNVSDKTLWPILGTFIGGVIIGCQSLAYTFIYLLSSRDQILRTVSLHKGFYW